MTLANCPRCGALFNKTTMDFCQKCWEEEERLLRKTQDYLRKNRTAPMLDVISEIGVEQWMIEKWIDEKRISLYDPEAPSGVHYCASCGRETKPGELLCKTCQFKHMSAKNKNSTKWDEDKIIEKRERARGMYFKRS
ncbi:MAG: TIGR03826 family flagellar region protein [Candidatus Hinthialibacter sp.]